MIRRALLLYLRRLPLEENGAHELTEYANLVLGKEIINSLEAHKLNGTHNPNKKYVKSQDLVSKIHELISKDFQNHNAYILPNRAYFKTEVELFGLEENILGDDNQEKEPSILGSNLLSELAKVASKNPPKYKQYFHPDAEYSIREVLVVDPLLFSFAQLSKNTDNTYQGSVLLKLFDKKYNTNQRETA